MAPSDISEFKNRRRDECSLPFCRNNKQFPFDNKCLRENEVSHVIPVDFDKRERSLDQDKRMWGVEHSDCSSPRKNEHQSTRLDTTSGVKDTKDVK